MKIKPIILLRGRNEGLIAQDTLDHLSQFGDKIYVYDDASTDNMVEICKKHPNVIEVISNCHWSKNQQVIQSWQRKQLFDYVRMIESKENIFMYCDFDERIDWNFEISQTETILKNVHCIAFKLFNAIITKDNQADYKEGKLMDSRKFFDSNLRIIPFIFTKFAQYIGTIPCERYPQTPGGTIIAGHVQHYGRAISIKQFEHDAQHYIDNVPLLSEKWERELQIGAIRQEEGLISWEECKKL